MHNNAQIVGKFHSIGVMHYVSKVGFCLKLSMVSINFRKQKILQKEIWIYLDTVEAEKAKLKR